MLGTDLDGRVALVTGASRGIGKAIALRLAREGVRVALVARAQEGLEAVRDTIVAARGSALVLPADVSREGDVQAVVQATAAAYGRLDILVNCAGIGVFRPLVETSVQDWDRVMAVNVRGPFLMCREAVPLMSREGGVIVNIASVVGLKGYINQAAYTASKHALMGMTKVLAQEVQSLGIRVHAVCPGGVDTEMAADARPDLDRSLLMRPEEVAEAVLWLIAQRGNAIVDQLNIRRASAAPWFD